jgi:hypothetical protein
LAARTAVLLALALSAVLAPASDVHADREACISAHEDAQLMRLRGRYTAARERLLSCAQSACPALISNDCIAWLAEVDASLPSVVFAVADSDSRDLIEVKVHANGALLTERIDGRAVPLDPGVYTLRFEAPGYARFEQVVTVREGQKQRLIRAQLAPLEPGAAAAAAASGAEPAAERRLMIPLSSYVLGGTALASLGVGITLAALGKRELDRLEPKCEADGCTRGEKVHGKRLYVTADVAFGVSAGLAIAATWLYFTARGKRKRDASSGSNGLRASFHGSGGLLTWRGEL